MAKTNSDENNASKAVYSQAVGTLNQDDAKSISENIERLEEENKSIVIAMAKLEQETSILRELFNNANSELSNLKKPSLLVADVVSVHDDKAVIKLPNGNKFFCY